MSHQAGMPPKSASSHADSARKELDDIFGSLGEMNLEGQLELMESYETAYGASSDVFRGKWPAMNKTVAVKRIRSFLLDDLSFARVGVVSY